ncbi:MAG: imidazoleglycerol-phosphate dehydratase HisB [Campylobacterales bacterium]
MITKERNTRETQIRLALNFKGAGRAQVKTGIGFFDHMLESLCKHALMDLELTCDGDLHVDGHHTVEDVGILLGQAMHEAIFPAQGIERFADRIAVLDEAAVQAALDISGRPYLFWELPVEGKVGDFEAELAEEFFRALVTNMRISAHITLLRGVNKHHIIEAAFKAFAIALRTATAANDRVQGVPSTKGVL